MDIASKEGKPIMRPMFFDYYKDPVCYELEDQYMFGEDILFAPITEQGCISRKVYLPEGQLAGREQQGDSQRRTVD